MATQHGGRPHARLRPTARGWSGGWTGCLDIGQHALRWPSSKGQQEGSKGEARRRARRCRKELAAHQMANRRRLASPAAGPFRRRTAFDAGRYRDDNPIMALPGFPDRRGKRCRTWMRLDGVDAERPASRSLVRPEEKAHSAGAGGRAIEDAVAESTRIGHHGPGMAARPGRRGGLDVVAPGRNQADAVRASARLYRFCDAHADQLGIDVPCGTDPGNGAVRRGCQPRPVAGAASGESRTCPRRSRSRPTLPGDRAAESAPETIVDVPTPRAFRSTDAPGPSRYRPQPDCRHALGRTRRTIIPMIRGGGPGEEEPATRCPATRSIA